MTIRYLSVDLVAFSDYFTRISPLVLFLLLLAAVALVASLWFSVWVGLAFGAFALIDWAMLALLPHFERSFGPYQLPWMSLLGLRLIVALVGALGPWLPGTILVQLGLSLSATYACWIEPMRLGVTRISLSSPRLNGCPPLRLLHLSDLHIERITDRERHLLRLVEELGPDLIVITGDYLSISYTYDAVAQNQTREFLSQLRAPGGVFAITGSPSVDPIAVLVELMDGLPVTWLRDRVVSVDWHGCHVRIAGVECSYDVRADEHKMCGLLNVDSSDPFTLLLYHTPDVMPSAVRAGVDLYLAGHTHGGQLRLPWFGAIVTASEYGKRYEMGLYREGDTLLYVSRGIGLEGKGAPRARFLCPPEIALFELSGVQDGS
jgi:predicted MPP superfamily phosphohydrolase